MNFHADALPLGAPSLHTIGILLDTILTNNNLSFMDNYFLQLVDTAMGAKVAPAYAKLFMSCHEETIREAFIWTIFFWKRFIDDIFLTFPDTTNLLQTLQGFMNLLHPTIKFTFQQISFLDMKIQIGADRKLSTTVYRKLSYCAALLHFHSNHSLKSKESIIFSQALRYNVLIADDHLTQKELDSHAISLLARKYLLDIISHNIPKALLYPCDTFFHKPTKASGSRTVLPIIIPYAIEGKSFSQLVRDQ